MYYVTYEYYLAITVQATEIHNINNINGARDIYQGICSTLMLGYRPKTYL